MNCFESAFKKFNIPFDRNVLNKNRGKDKSEMIRLSLKANARSDDFLPEIYKQFKIDFAANVNQFKTRDGALDIFRQLKRKSIKIGIGSGMEREL